MADVRRSGGSFGDAADREQTAAGCQLLEEAAASLDLGAGWAPVRGFGPGVGRDDVPAEGVLLELQFLERGADDRRRRLGGACPGHLTLGRERHTADTRATVARSLADQEETGMPTLRQVARQATPQEAGARAFAIKVERGTDLRSGQLLDKAHGSHSDGRRPAAARDRACDRGLAR